MTVRALFSMGVNVLGGIYNYDKAWHTTYIVPIAGISSPIVTVI